MDNNNKSGGNFLGYIALAGLVFLLGGFMYLHQPKDTGKDLSKPVSIFRDKLYHGPSSELEGSNTISLGSSLNNPLNKKHKIRVSQLSLHMDGTGSFTYNNARHKFHLAGVNMVPVQSRFYKENTNSILKQLKNNIYSSNKNNIEIEATKKNQSSASMSLYVYINGKLLQQTLLSQGLAFIESERYVHNIALFTSQDTAKENKRNIWQIQDVIKFNRNKKYYWSFKNEENFYNNRPVESIRFRSIKETNIIDRSKAILN